MPLHANKIMSFLVVFNATYVCRIHLLYIPSCMPNNEIIYMQLIHFYVLSCKPHNVLSYWKCYIYVCHIHLLHNLSCMLHNFHSYYSYYMWNAVFVSYMPTICPLMHVILCPFLCGMLYMCHMYLLYALHAKPYKV